MSDISGARVSETTHERWLRAVMETAADGVILIDARGTVLMFNPACERLFKYSSNEVIGQNVKMLMRGPYREEHDHYLDNFQRTGERKIIGIGREVFGQRKDGTTFPMDLSVGEARQDEGSIFVGNERIVLNNHHRLGAEGITGRKGKLQARNLGATQRIFEMDASRDRRP